jgi:hypothetical protein
MTAYLVPLWALYLTLGFILVLFLFILGCIFFIYKQKKYDYVIFLDGDKSFRIERISLKNKENLNLKSETYALNRDCLRINSKGRKLYVFNEHKPEPLRIEGNKSLWLSSSTLTNMINNEVLKLMFKMKTNLDNIILLCCILAGVSAIASVFVAIKVFGLIK